MPRVHINQEPHDVPILTTYELIVVLATAGHDETPWIVTYESAENGAGELHKGELIHVVDCKTTFTVKPP